jgi:hypothetical protein
VDDGMSQQPRRRVRAVPVSRRVGEPNVLSDQAIPNRLSTMGPPASAAGARRPPRPAQAGPGMTRRRTGTSAPSQPATDDAPPAQRLPSFGTVLFIAFLLLTIFRLISSFLSNP